MTRGGGHDPVDPSLIVKSSRVSQPSKRVRGVDYPETVGNTAVQLTRKSGANSSKEKKKATSLEEEAPPTKKKKQLTLKTLLPLKDPTKPDGEAVNADGSLKPADEIKWLNSPSDELRPSILGPDEDMGDIGGHVAPAKMQEQKKSHSFTFGSRHLHEDEDMGDLNVAPEQKKSHSFTFGSRHMHEDEDTDFGMDIDKLEVDEEGEEVGEEENEGDEMEEDLEEDGIESIDEEADKRYWEAKANEGIRKPKKKSHATRDIRLSFQHDTCLVNGVVKAGAYCRWCLMDVSKTKADAFLYGNGSALRTHITRFHYSKYLALCKSKNIEPKARPPADWGKKKGQTQNLDSFIVAVKKPPPPVTKAGIKEYLLELIVDADLSFRFVERASFCRLVCYLCPKLTEADIPKRTCMGNAILEKVERLDDIDMKILNNVVSLVSLIFDGWTTKRRRPYTSTSIQYIDSPPDDPFSWTLKSHLLAFENSVGRHTGILMGQELVNVIRKFNFEDKFGWLVGDNVSVNDVAARYVCKELKPRARKLNAKEIRGRCIEHTMHLMACHFIKALNIPSLARVKQGVHGKGKEVEVEEADKEAEASDSDDDELDIDTNMEVEASADDAEALREAAVTDFEPGDVVGKMMAFIAQLRSCGQDTRDYLKRLGDILGCPQLEIKLWIWTRWGSLSDCFRVTLALQKALDQFCLFADTEEALPPLASGKKWANYRMSISEWRLIRLAHHCLNILANSHGKLSASKTPTCHKVLPLLEELQSQWEDLLGNEEYEQVHHALEAGLKNMKKWYQATDDTSIYFISHVLNPARKLTYVSAAWEPEYVEMGMVRLRKIFLTYHAKYHVQKKTATQSSKESSKPDHHDSVDDWMDRQIKKSGQQLPAPQATPQEDPLAELKRFFDDPPVSRSECADLIAWWGAESSHRKYPIFRMLDRDYLAIPASTCLAERSFSMSARTDDCRRRQIGSEKFGGLQRLRSGYRDGRLEAVKEAWMEIDPDFEID